MNNQRRAGLLREKIQRSLVLLTALVLLFSSLTGTFFSTDGFSFQDFSLDYAEGATGGRGEEIYVDVENGNDSAGDGSEGNPYRTIQKGVDTASDGDSIFVNPGNYSENIVIEKMISLRSTEKNYQNTNVSAADPKKHTIKIRSDWVNISGLRVMGATGRNQAGISVNGFSHVNLSNNNCTGNKDGILLQMTEEGVIMGNIVHSNDNNGIRLQNSGNNLIRNNTVTFHGTGILLSGSKGNTLRENKITDNYNGISLSASSDSNTLSENTVHSNFIKGLEIHQSSGCILSNNTLRDNKNLGLYLNKAPDSQLRNNTISDNGYNFGIYGSELADYIQDIDVSNTVNGKSIIYWIGENNRTVPENAGMVVIVNSQRIVVEDQEIKRNSNGILVLNSDNCIIRNNTILEVKEGAIQLDYTSELNLIEYNVIHKNNFRGTGIALDSSSYNSIINNTVNRYHYGVKLDASHDNHLSGNTLYEDKFGIHLLGSDRNHLTGNNASGNTYEGYFLMSSDDNNLSGNIAESNNQNGITLFSSSRNRVLSNLAKDNSRYDIFFSFNRAYTEGYFDNIGSGDRPIKFVNSATEIKDVVLSELILCNADGSTLSNVTIIGSDQKRNNGLLVFATDDSKFRNITSSGNYYGMHFSYSTGNDLADIELNNNELDGIRLYESSDRNDLYNLNTSGNDGMGVFLYSSFGNVISGSSMDSNKNRGITLTFSHNNTIRRNRITSNKNHGINLISSDDNLIYDNLFNNSNNALDYGNNVWNVSRVLETNILGAPFISGNFWHDYTGIDIDGDVLGDTETPYDSGGNIWNGGDYNPLLPSTPVLQVEKTAEMETVRPGGSLNYTILITNIWSHNVTNITVNESYDDAVTFLSSDPVPGDGNNRWFIPSLAVSETLRMNISVIVEDDLHNGDVITNLVVASGDQGDPAISSITTPVTAPVISLNITDDTDPIPMGGSLNYTVEITNTGLASATNVKLTVHYDDNVSFQSSSPLPDEGDNNWTFPSLEPGEAIIIIVSVLISDDVRDEAVLATGVELGCDQGITLQATEETTVFDDTPPERIIIITLEELRGMIRPDDDILIAGNVTIQPEGAIREVRTLLDGEDHNSTSVNGFFFNAIFTLPDDLAEGNHTITVNVTLVTGETAQAEIVFNYTPPENITHIINITFDPIQGTIGPGSEIQVSGLITIKPYTPILEVVISLDTVILGAAPVAGSTFSALITLPPSLANGSHTIDILVYLETGESQNGMVIISYVEPAETDDDKPQEEDEGNGMFFVVILIIFLAVILGFILFRSDISGMFAQKKEWNGSPDGSSEKGEKAPKTSGDGEGRQDIP